MGAKEEEILKENVIGINQDKLKSHHDFLPSVLTAMQEYAAHVLSEVMPSDEEIEREASRFAKKCDPMNLTITTQAHLIQGYKAAWDSIKQQLKGEK